MNEQTSRAYTTPPLQKHFVQLWKKSGLPRVEFCKKQQLNVKCFYRWVKKYSEPSSAAAPKMLPLKQSSSLATHAASSSIELIMPNHYRLKLSSDINPKYIATLLKELSHEN